MPAADAAAIQEHPEFFFPDGNVVFLAGSNPAIAFCLHRGIANRWSPTIQGIIDALDATPDPAIFKGHRVIELDDGSLDFERLVRVMYDGTNASLPVECTSDTFPHLASVLLLAHKYGISHLFDHARSILVAAYPDTLPAWDTREAYEFGQTNRYNRLTSVRRYAPPLAVVSVALQLGAPHLLVPAYLDLARLPASEIICGFTTTAPIANHPAGLTLQLRPQQTTAVLRGKETLQRFIADFIKSDVEFRAPAPQCRYIDLDANAGPSPCTITFARVAHDMLVMVADVTGGVDSDPLFILSCALDMLDRGPKEGSRGRTACAACTDWFRQSVHAARQHVWVCLDKWFNLRKVIENGFDAGGWD